MSELEQTGRMQGRQDDVEDFLDADPKARAAFEDRFNALEAAEIVRIWMETAPNAEGEPGLSQAVLGERLGVSQTRISQIINADRGYGPSYSLLKRICLACGFAWPQGLETALAEADEGGRESGVDSEAARGQTAFPDFEPGDTLRLHYRTDEGEGRRVQILQGVCIDRKGAGLNASFTLRKVSFGEGVEYVFPLLTPKLWKIEIVARGRVRRAKLYRHGRTGKSIPGVKPAGKRVLGGKGMGVADAAKAIGSHRPGKVRKT